MKKQMNGQKTHWLRNTLCVLIACGILGTILSAVLFLTNLCRRQCTVLL